MKRLLNRIRSDDVFGYQITLNFNQSGRTHKTLCGGFMSLIMKVLVAWYVIYKSAVLVSKGQSDKYTYSSINQEILDGKSLNFNSTKLFPYYVLKKQKGLSQEPIFLTEETSRYIDISFSQEIIDWKINIKNKERVQDFRIEAR